MPQQTYWKVPFEWTATTPPPDDALPAGWSWRDGTTLAAPVGLVGEVLANSPGPEDRRAVDQLGADEAARRLVALAPGFSYLPSCWHVLMVRRSMAGFVLPVIYDGCARDGLDEATIYHMGVAPAYRSQGIGRLLLRHATQALVNHGIWRAYCDTPSNDYPMIHLFETERWKRLPDHERPIAELE
ncbi:GNAT family N-acetyltransferase [Flexivirga oryzae]|uniref:GNAT superfamily N-acetyltransferase n=1 Tax=Flexivirga oryzae TaxID=1794944 RepID=A0A839NIN3_9MICO|nr:GNAT family N-acetyltransferase [Flexivirga oryzae]MBB2894252.1 GNAT superfamily N-acetyltransferase [Flexivirga oryzae]